MYTDHMFLNVCLSLRFLELLFYDCCHSCFYLRFTFLRKVTASFSAGGTLSGTIGASFNARDLKQDKCILIDGSCPVISVCRQIIENAKYD